MAVKLTSGNKDDRHPVKARVQGLKTELEFTGL
nr:transposase [Photorhabdus khanii]